jgi:LPXTG-motif cell wall-anchored protein
LVSSNLRAGIVLTAAASLALSTLGVAHAEPVTTDDPAAAAAGWLATQLSDGERIVNTDFGFDDAGLTADVVFALASAGVASGSIGSATDWLATQVGGYTGTESAEDGFTGVYAGATAKLILVANTTGRDPRAFGGTDLVAQLEAREQADGRFTDDSSFGDFSNVITQSLAILALERTSGTDASDVAVALLAAQACDDGGFPQDLQPATCTASIDATGFAIQALAAAGETAAVDAAAAWLVSVQAGDGGFGNANSTGLAAVALALGGQDAAVEAARANLIGLQADCTDERAGAILFDASDGGDPVRASAQAVPGITGISLATVSAAGASADVPAFDCPGAPPVDPEPAPQPDATPDATTVADAAQDELPATGGGSGLLALLGVAMLAVATLLLTSTRRTGTAR